MKFRDIFRRKSLRASTSVVEALQDRRVNPYPVIGGTNLVNPTINAAVVRMQSASYGWIYKTQPSVRTVVDLIARNVCQLDLRLYEHVSANERKDRSEHPAAETMRLPNEVTPGLHFIYQMVTDYLVFDNAYALKLRTGPDAPLTLLPLPPASTGVIGNGRFTVDGYRIWRTDGSFFDVPPEDVIHWRGVNPADDPRMGVSKLETLREELALDAANMTAATELAKSGLSAPGHIERPVEAPEWSEEARKRFEEDWANRAKQSGRRHPVLEEGMTFKDSGISPKDAQTLENRKFTLAEVARLYGVPLGLVGLEYPLQMDVQEQTFYADVLPPVCEMFTAFLDLSVLRNEFDEPKLFFAFNLDEKLMGNDRLSALVSASGAPILTRNESRAMLNMPPLDGGDELLPPEDQLVVPLNVLTGGKPSPQVMPIQDPNGPPQDGSHRMELPPPSEDAPPGKSLVPRRARADHRRDGWARKYEDLLVEFFNRQGQTVKSRRAEAKAVTSERWNKELAADLNKLYFAQFSAEGKFAAQRMASSFDPGQGVNWLGAKAIGTAEAINAVTEAQIIDQGIADAFAVASETRAAGAAMGMASDISAFSTKVAIEQAPDSHSRTVTIFGGDCPICAEFQGTWPANDVPGWPAYHANCNCQAEAT